MRKLANLIRSAQAIDNAVRGPKKKGGSQLKIQSTDIINIFKDRTDPQPMDISQYPLFVQQLSLNHNTYHEQIYAVQQNIDYLLPTKPTYKAFLKGLKRQRFKTIRNFKQLDQMSIEKDQKFQIHERVSVYDFFNKTKEQLAQQRKAAQAAMAAQQDQDDD